MGLLGWEDFFEKNMEGFFQRRFGSALEPAEVERAIEQELMERRKKDATTLRQ